MPKARPLTPKMITDFCRLRLKGVLDEDELAAVSNYLIGLLELMAFPPYRGKWIDWADVSLTAGVDKPRLSISRYQLQPIFDALSKNVALQDVTEPVRPSGGYAKLRDPRQARHGSEALRALSAPGRGGDRGEDAQ